MAGSKRKRRQITYGGKRHHARLHVGLLSDDDMSWFPSTDQMNHSQKPPPLPANKPTSQKAATMPAEPCDEDIRAVQEFTELPRSDAIRYLKAKNGVEAAVGAYFEGEDISKVEQASQWDESLWSAGKDGAGGGEHHLHPLGSSAAATRPNSPAPSTGNRSNLHPNSKQEEDEDLARAMAMSTGDLGASFQQETGRIGADGQQTTFGPANRDHYEKGQWEMVPVNVHNTTEIIPDTDIQQRLNGQDEPRLLKYLPTGDYTPNLLTICHAINGARQALLMRDYVQMSYGQHSDWWRGESITLPKVVNLVDNGAAEPETDNSDELLAEIQRIMAFLSASARSYASVGALMNTEAIKSSSPEYATPSGTRLELLLQNWTLAASMKSASAGDELCLFNTTIGTNSAEGSSTSNRSLIDMPVNISQDGKSDLLEQLDQLLWDAKISGEDVSENYIQRPADVLVIRAHQQNPTAAPQLRLEVPAEFYVDKYLPENIEATRATRMRMVEGRQRIAKIEEIETKLSSWKHPKKSEQLGVDSLFRHTHGYFSGKNRQDIMKRDKSGQFTDEQKNTVVPENEEIAQKLEKIMASIEDKLNVLKEEKEKTRRAIAGMSRAPPPGLQTGEQTHRYTLRGVATKPNVTYVMCPAKESTDWEMVQPEIEDETTPQGMQWWRMDYDVSGTGASVTKTKVPDFDVLRAVELEHSSALLVYANDRANNAPNDDSLPQALEDFVQRDNNLFTTELAAEQNRPPPAYELDNEPIETIERTSLDSTRVEGGGSDFGGPSPPGYGDDDFMNRPDFGMGPNNIKQGYSVDGPLDGEVHEIRLSPPEDEGIEMTEKPHALRIAGGDGDAPMEDMR